MRPILPPAPAGNAGSRVRPGGALFDARSRGEHRADLLAGCTLRREVGEPGRQLLAAVRLGLGVEPSRAVRRAHQRAGHHPGEPDPLAVVEWSTNSSGLTQRSTGWWRSDGRRYWVIVIISQPASYRSLHRRGHLLGRLAHAEDQVPLGDEPGGAGLADHVEGALVAEPRPDAAEDPRHRLEVVREHLGRGVEDRPSWSSRRRSRG